MSLTLPAPRSNRPATTTAPDPLPTTRGPLSSHVLAVLTGAPTAPVPEPVSGVRNGATSGALDDGDFQLALWLCEIARVAHLRGVTDEQASSLRVLELRWFLQRTFEDHLVRHVAPAERPDPFAVLDELCTPSPGTDPPVERALLAKAPYLAWEADPHTLTLAHVEDALKQPLAEIQAGEYGVGHRRTHADIYRGCLDALGADLADVLDDAPAEAFAWANLTWLFASTRRWRGASLGQLCLYEADSVGPARRARAAWDEAGLPEAGRRWYDVHALADAEHEEIVRQRLLPTIVDRTPHLVPQVVFGMRATAWVGSRLRAALR